MFSNTYRRIAALPVRAKVLLAIATLVVLVLSVLLSPFVVVLALLVLVVAVFALIFRALRRRPLKSWGLIALASLLFVILFSGISQALYGQGAPQQQASSPPEQKEEASSPSESNEEAAQQETPSEEAEQTAGPEETGSAQEAAQRESTRPKRTQRESTRQEPPPPRTPEERIQRSLGKVFPYAQGEAEDYKIDETRPDPERAKAHFHTDQTGCLNVRVNYRDTGPLLRSGASTESEIGTTMRQIHEAIYSDRQTRSAICNATAAAYGEFSDAYGNKSEEKIYATSMSRDVAERINWSDSYSADFERLWTVEYEHPDVEAATLKEGAQQALDCVQQGGLFDFDWLEC